MKLTKWKPMEADRGFLGDPFFGRFFDLLEEGGWERPAKEWYPALDMVEEGDHLALRFELPGIDPKSIDVQLSGDRLTISGERKFEKTETAKVLKREQVYGTFSRSVTLPYHVDATKVKATYENGVMNIELPKAEEFIGRQIPVEMKS